jgi:hypothetical protein
MTCGRRCQEAVQHRPKIESRRAKTFLRHPLPANHRRLPPPPPAEAQPCPHPPPLSLRPPETFVKKRQVHQPLGWQTPTSSHCQSVRAEADMSPLGLLPRALASPKWTLLPEEDDRPVAFSPPRDCIMGRCSTAPALGPKQTKFTPALLTSYTVGLAVCF